MKMRQRVGSDGEIENNEGDAAADDALGSLDREAFRQPPDGRWIEMMDAR